MMKWKLPLLVSICLLISAQKHIGGQLLEAAFENLTTDPGSGNIEGRAYWDSDDDLLRVYDGSAYKTIGDVSGAGDVSGPGSSTDNALARFDATTGKLLQNSSVTVDDTNVMRGFTRAEGSGYAKYWEPTSADPTLGYVGPTEIILDNYFVIQNDADGSAGEYIEFYLKDTAVPNKLIDFVLSHTTTTASVLMRQRAGAGSESTFRILADSATPSDNYLLMQATGGGLNSSFRVEPDGLTLAHSGGGSIKLRGISSNNGVDVVVPNIGTTYTLTLPSAQGAGALTNDGSGNLSWEEITQLKLETSAPTCTGAEKGQLIYNSTSNYPCHCTGAAWQKVSDNTSCF